MKLYRNIIFFLIAILCVGVFVGCNEDDTLDGASEVYITLNPVDITLRVGDTVKISAAVTNLSGNRIETPVTWTVLDENVAKVLGDTAIVCIPGAQGKRTKLKAELVNGKYALTSVFVTTNLPKGVTPVNESGAVISSRSSYNLAHDSVLFAISPKELLDDFEPQYTIEGFEPFRIPMTVYKDKGLVAVHYVAPRAAVVGKITVSMGEESSAQSASCTVVAAPKLLATFYGEKYEGMDYIGTRPDKSVLPQYFAYTYESNMDMNSETTIRVAINTESGAREDIEAAAGSYRWEAISGSAVIVSEKYEDFVENQGFDAVLTLRSGIEEGEAEFHCITPDTVLVVAISVEDYTNRYPVNEITVSHESIKIPVGGLIFFKTGVVPSTSYAYHKPVVVAENPNIIGVGEYDRGGNTMTLTGLEIGETKLVLTSNGKQLEVPVTITEGITSVTWEEGNQLVLFAGQSVLWGVKATTTSGGENPYDVNWISSDTSILNAVQVDGDNTKGLITAVAPGEATISAEVVDKSTKKEKVKVIDLPSDQVYTSDNTNYENTGVLDENGDLVLTVQPTSGQKIILTLVGAYSGSSYNGTYQVGSYPIKINIDEAIAPVTSGYVTIASDANGDALISFDLTVSIADGKAFTLKADKLLGFQ